MVDCFLVTLQGRENKLSRLLLAGLMLIVIVLGAETPACAIQIDTQMPSVVVVTSAGDKVEGTLESLDLDSLTLQVKEEKAKFQFEQIESLSTGVESVPPSEGGILIRLIDDSVFNGNAFSISAKRLKLKTASERSHDIETRNIASVRFKVYPNDLKLSKQWREILGDSQREGDALVVNRSGELNAIEGIVGETESAKLNFSIGDRTAKVGLEKIDAILFYHAAGRELADPICAVELSDGSSVLAQRLEWNGSQVQIASVAGTAIKVGLGEIVRFDFSMGRSELLSNREPTTNDWQALMTSSAIMEKLRRLKLAKVNRSFGGDPLSLKFFSDDGAGHLSEIRQFEHGFAMQGGGKLAFSLNGQFNNLKGWVGFDPRASESGQVKLIVLADGKPLVEKVLIHRTIRQPLELDLNIKDVKRLVFQVDYHDGRSTGDQIHLVELKVSQ